MGMLVEGLRLEYMNGFASGVTFSISDVAGDGYADISIEGSIFDFDGGIEIMVDATEESIDGCDVFARS